MLAVGIGFLLLAAVMSAETLSPLGVRGYGVVPLPQKVELTNSDLRFGPAWSLELASGVPGDDVAVETLREELQTRFGIGPPGTLPGATRVRLSIQPGTVRPEKTTDRDSASIAAQAYRIEISRDAVVLAANARPGLFYAVETLAQLLRPHAGALWMPEGRLTDWPDLHLRHIYWDDAHHLEHLSELKRAVRQAAFFKINGFALKLEGHFQFRSAPALVEPYALTPAEYQDLTDYGLRYHVEVIPYLDGPAHIAFILKHPEYARFRSFPDSNYELCTVNPEAVKFLGGMFRDLIDANKGGHFVYLSTDEPYYIGLADNPQCRERQAAEEAGTVGKLLAHFVSQIANPLHDAGRTVIFWGEYPLKPGDIPALPSHLVNGEVYGPAFDPLFKKRGIRQMIYTSTQGGEARFFPDYFALPNARRLHPVPTQVDRLRDGFRTISYSPAREQADLMGAVVAGWADMGLHPDTFWLGYATITAAGWHPGRPSVDEAAATFYRVFYGDSVVRMDRLYQLMSQQAHSWLDSWDWGPSKRKPIFGNSNRIFTPRQPVKDQTIALAGSDPEAPSAWLKDNGRRLQLAADGLADNDELLGLIQENIRKVERNRYDLEIDLAIARLYRQNFEMLLDLGRICSLIERAARNPEDGIEPYDRALDLARQIRQQRNAAFRDAAATYEKSWFPRVAEANGRKFLHELDDVKDHVPDRTVDLSYMIDRELQLPFGEWVENIRAARNRLAESRGLKADNRKFDWLDMGDHPVVGGIPEE
jgi:hexosaminidase